MRSVFEVIFDKMERLQGEVKGKEVTELVLKRNLNEAQGKLMRKREKVYELKKDKMSHLIAS